MSFLNQKMKFGIRGKYQWWSIISYLMFGIMAGSLIFSSIIIYNYTFRTLEDAHTIVLLNTDAVVNNVNMEMYKRAVDAIAKKNEPSGFAPGLRNIFVFDTSTPKISESIPSNNTSTSLTTSTEHVSTSTP